ncbi:MAG: class I SAM-dependent methyltransferase [Eubacterium sp.]|nr:class I SAM-dependent methyltransferase [Eubacterium sp.]
MDQYAAFAEVYDLFMDNIDYGQWFARIRELLEQQNIQDGIVCELGCGTGTMTELLAEAGYDMIGIDASPEMLEAATEKKLVSGHDILYLLQDARSFELYGTVKAIVSVCDSLNYVTDPAELLQVFRLVNNYLDPDGIFLFDMNTPVRYASIGDDTIAENREEGSFIWENQYDPESQINEYLLTLFLPELPLAGEGVESGAVECGDAESGRAQSGDRDGTLYRKTEEYHCQRAYSPDEVKDLLHEAGLVFLAAWDGYTGRTVSGDSERVLYMAREQGKKNNR